MSCCIEGTPPAKPLFRRALQIDEASYGRIPRVAIELLTSRPAGARTGLPSLSHVSAGVAVDEATMGGSPTVAIRLNNLAVLLEAKNRLAEAEPLYRRVVKIFEIARG